MPPLPNAKALATALLAGIAAPAQGTATLLADLNPVFGTNPSSNPRFGAQVGSGDFVFAARTTACGEEPWVISAAGTSPVLLRDIAPGGDSDPYGFTSINGIVVFVANDQSTGYELWRTDGTLGGTWLLRDIEPGPGSSSPQHLTPFAGRVFFRAQSGGDTELWATDGTTAGTVRVADVRPGPTSSLPVNLTVAGAALFFRSSPPTGGWELWKTDGTAAGTVLVQTIQPSGVASPSEFRAVGATLFFTGFTSTTGQELWRSDGTTAGTALVRDIVPGPISSAPSDLIDLGGVLYFAARISPTSGPELWRSDGTVSGTVVVRDIYPGSGGSAPQGLLRRGTDLLFSADDGVHGRELWISDGTTAGTGLLLDIRPGPTGSDPAALVLDDPPGRLLPLLYLAADDGMNGRELWRTNGTAAGTVLVADLSPGAAGSGPSAAFALPATALVRGPVVFAADNGTTGTELCRTNGTTVTVADLNPALAASDPHEFVSDGRRTFFVADDGVHGQELWVSDGTAAGTGMLVDAAPGTASSSPTGLFLADGVLYCSITTPGAGAEPWRSDGTSAGTWLLRDLVPGTAGSFPLHFTAWNGQVWFAARDPALGRELHRTDGTAAGTVLAVDVAAGASSADPGELTPLGGRLLFVAGTALFGRELWSTDGTPGGTGLVYDIENGPTGSNPAELTRLGSQVLFAATTWYAGRELWRTDGTLAGTAMVADLAGNTQSASPRELTLVEFVPGAPVVCFAAAATALGEELFRTDGTATVLVRDLQAGAGSGTPRALTRMWRPGRGDLLLFAARDDAAGLEPWISGGTTATTQRVRDLLPGPMSSLSADGSWFFAAPGARQVVFPANSGTSGVELWRYDVEADTLALHQDIRAGLAGSNPGAPVLVGARLLFAADDGSGAEPWAMTSMAAAYPYGHGCPGPAGTPELTPNSAPSHGNAAFGYRLANAGPGNATILLLDVQRSAQAFGACTVWCQPFVAALAFSDGAGVAAFPLPLSPDPVWAGLTIDAQGLVFVPGGAILGLAVGSNGLEVLVGR